MYKLVVLFSVVALVAGKPGVYGPVVYSAAVPAVSSVSQYSTSVHHGVPVASVYSSPAFVAPAVVPAYGYGLSQAPHSPAVVLDAVNGVPLDTPEVVAARAAHFQAKALSGHHVGKRSAPVAYSSYVAPVSSLAYSSPVISPYSSVVSPYSSVVSPYSSVVSPYSSVVTPYSAALASPYVVAPKAYSVHPW